MIGRGVKDGWRVVRVVALVMTFGICIPVVAAAPASRGHGQISEQEICSYQRGPGHEPLAAAVSPDGRHVALRFSNDRGEAYRIDDRPQPTYAAVSAWFAFSPDGAHVAYAAKVDSGWCVVVDSVPGPRFDGIGDARFQFSADGRHFAYVAISARIERLMLDHSSVPEGDQPSEFQLSRDGTRIAYLVWRGGRCRVFVNGLPDREFDGFLEGSLRFSPNGQRFGYVASLGESTVTVVDGAIRDTAEAANGPYFSADGRRAAFALMRGSQWSFAEPGRKGPTFEGLNTPGSLFSPDGARRMYVARRQGRRALVVDDQPAGDFDYVSTPRFAPAGPSRACFVKQDGRWSALIDGKTGPTFDDIGSGGPVFSPDGARVAYLGRTGELWQVVLDGVAQKRVNAVFEERLSFSPDGRHLAYAAQTGTGWWLMLDGAPTGWRYDAVFVNGPTFRADGKVEMIAARQDGEWIRVFRVTAAPRGK